MAYTRQSATVIDSANVEGADSVYSAVLKNSSAVDDLFTNLNTTDARLAEDVPAISGGDALKVLRVNSGETALEYAASGALVSSNDTTPGYLNGKLVAGTSIALTEGSDGGNETLTVGIDGAVAVANGGTGATDAATARTNLGLVIGTDVLAPTGDGSGLTGIVVVATDQQLKQIYLNAARLASASGDLAGGYQWAFNTDELATKTNATYNASGDYYYNPGDPVLIDRTSGTAIGNLTGGGGLAAAFDGNTDQAWTACANISSAVLGYIGKDYGSGITKQVVKATVYSSNDRGFYEGDTGGAYTLTLQGSNNNSDWTDLGTASGNDSNSAYSKDITVSSPSDYRYYRIKTSVVAGSWPAVAEVQFFEAGTPANMTLIPSAVTADAQPTDIDVYFVHKAIDTVTMGTDCKLAASRDGGTTWVGLGDAESAYTEVASLPDGSKIWKKSHDMTSAETGSVVTMGLVTDNNKEQELHAFLMIWGG